MKRPTDYDPKHDQNAICAGCGHTYERHFDWGDNNRPGCKYCYQCYFIGPGAPPPIGAILYEGLLEDQAVRIIRVDEHNTYCQSQGEKDGSWDACTDEFSLMIYEMAFLSTLNSAINNHPYMKKKG